MKHLLSSAALTALMVAGGALWATPKAQAQVIVIDGNAFPSPLTLNQNLEFTNIVSSGDDLIQSANPNAANPFALRVNEDASIGVFNTLTISAPIIADPTSAHLNLLNLTINESDDGTLILSGNNDLLDATLIVRDGTLSFQNSAAHGNTSLQLIGGTIDFADGFNAGSRSIIKIFFGDLNQSQGTATFGSPLSNNTSAIPFYDKTGAGTLILSGNNFTYSGRVRVMEGTLGAANSNSFGTGQVSLFGGGLLLTDGVSIANAIQSNSNFSRIEVETGNAATLTGNISGGSSLTKIGEGTLSLSNNNVGNSRLDVDAGTLIAGTGVTINASNLNVNGGTFRLDGAALNNATTFGVGASGTLDINNGFSLGTASTLTNAGTVDIAGGQTVAFGAITNNSGTISVGSGSTLQGVGNTLNNSSTIDVASNGTVTDGGDINNLSTGIINFNGPGGAATLTSGGAITNDGAINLNSGSLAITGDFINQGSGAFNIAAASGGATTTGAVSVAGSSTLTADNTFTGLTSFTQTGGTINGASIIATNGGFLQSGGTTGGTVDINAASFMQSGGATLAAGTFVTSAGTQTLSGGTIAGTLDGVGAVNVETGTTSFAGSITNAASFNLNSGTFVNNGIINSNAALNGGLLNGIGTFNGSVTANAGSRIAPGNSIGTINTGDLTLNAGSTLEIEVSQEGADQVNVTGAVTINGTTLALNDLAPILQDDSQTFVIINNDGTDTVTGSGFGTITDNLAFLIPDVSLNGGDGNDVEVSFTLDLDLPRAATTGNQSGAATAFASLDTNAPGVQTVLGAFVPLTDEAAQTGLNSLTGEVFGASSSATNTGGIFVGNSILDVLKDGTSQGQLTAQTGFSATSELAFVPTKQSSQVYAADLVLNEEETQPIAEDGRYIFSRGLFRDVQIDADGNGAETDVRNSGFIAGIGLGLNTQISAGLAAGYLRTDVDVDALGSSVDGDGLVLNLHGRFVQDSFDAVATLGYIYYDFSSSRQINVGAFNQVATADFDSHTIFGSAEIGQTTLLDAGLAVRLFLGGSFSTTNREAFSEIGADAANLFVAETTDTLGQFHAGIGLTDTYTIGQMTITPRLEAAVDTLFGDLTPATTATFAPGGLSFTSTGTEPGRVRGRIGAGITAKFSNSFTGFVDYAGTFSENDEEHAVQVGFKLKF